MSPSESELRAALHHGEGDVLDAAAVVTAARAAHRQRRARLGAVAGAVLAVAGIGIGSAIAFGGHSGRTPAAGSAATTAKHAPSGYDTGVTGRSPLPRTLPKAGTVQCPASAPNLTAPKGAGNGPLFRAPVQSIKACVYAGDGTPLLVDGKQPNAVLTGAAVTHLVGSLAAASANPPAHACPMYRTGNLRVLVLIAIGRDGSRLPPVTARIGLNPCNRMVTNGTAWRYGWTPPASLGALAHSSAPTAGSGSAPAGRATVSSAPPTLNRGSPPR